VANQNCLLLNKPVRLAELSQAIAGLMPSYQPASAVTVPQFSLTHTDEATPTIFIVDDDANVREALCQVIVANGSMASAFANGETFLAAYRGDRRGDCVLIDAYLPGMSGLEVLQRLRVAGHNVPVIMITGNSDVTMAVQAMKAGAADFIEKPVRAGDLLASMQRALEQSHDIKKFVAWRQAATDHLSALTPRQRQIMHMVLAGQPSKNIAADLDISQRTVENHRASIMKKTGSTSLPALARLALAASWTEDGEKAGS
jgi:two-component system CheB/CheR fusion protein